LGFEEIIVPSLAEQEIFEEKAGREILNQMYSFPDKKGRPICLIPEVTAVIQKQWREQWEQVVKKPYRVFYIQRCYRYERPQKGRYREFTQAGVEILGGKSPQDKEEAIGSLRACLDRLEVDYELKEGIKRGLSYYVEDGFEAEMASLGAQKQIAGGGRYAEGIGWAIGVDRVMLGP
tara:strand:+ start:1113 stop:1643 length:531 start_codon:yes stop_codon:yes gene_type:complete